MLKSSLSALAIATALTFPAHAGGLADPVMEPAIIVEETSTASSFTPQLPRIIFSLLTLVAMAK